ncbi:flagellar biosynthetic protein FliR [Endozoicomonas ascidiicola]|uniref:flagellar biosynthetic protein FliR n=1 Tax=Endozoicomonas ascidiicola TaxID=1698521 RepID=UPI000832F6C5|nr:flagellar biosynthetic protein FliR [Endozoicomonas ascidiicola]
MVTTAELTAWIGQIIWPACRIAAALWLMPIFGRNNLTRHVRLVLCISLSVLVAPLLPPLPVVEPMSIQAILLIAQQALIGLAMGFIILLWQAVFAFTGQVLSMQMGLAMAVMNDPTNGPGTPIIGKWLQTMALLVFLVMDGHMVIVQVLVESFRTLPIGVTPDNTQFMQLVMRGGWLFSSGLLVALPAVISMLLVNMAFGVMNRAAAQLNIFALGFPMTLLLGLFTMLFTLDSMSSVFVDLSDQSLLYLRQWTVN